MASFTLFPPQTASMRRAARRFYRRLMILYALNLSDWLCTAALLGSGRFAEANPLMRPVVNSFPALALLKGVLPLGLILLCVLLYRASGIEESRAVNAMLTVGIVAYTALNLWHIFNFVLLFSSF